MLKYVLLSVLLISTSAGFGQAVLPEEAFSARPLPSVDRLVEQAALHPIGQDTSSTQIPALMQDAYAAIESNNYTNAPGTKPWQLVVFLSVHERNLTPTLQQMSTQIRRGEVALATVFYIAPGAKSGTLHLLYAKGSQVVHQEQTWAASVDGLVLWENLLKQVQNNPVFYTGVFIEAHAYTTSFFSQKFTSEQIARAVVNQQVHVDLLNLTSCYASSLYNLYHWTKLGRIDYLVASSNASYGQDINIWLSLLQGATPAQIAVRSVQKRREQSHFSTEFATNSVSAIHLNALSSPLQEYIRLYRELFSYDSSEALYGQPFEQFFRGYELENLSDMLLKQRIFVRAHLTPHWPALYRTQQDFIAACNALRQALTQSTLHQWCYSKPKNELYVDYIPAGTGCLGNVNVAWDQYLAL